MRIGLFEDQTAGQFAPLSLMRPVFELVCGQFTVRERLVRNFSNADWFAFMRPTLTETYQQAHPSIRVNAYEALTEEPTLLLNGRWLADWQSIHELQNLQSGDAAVVAGNIVAIVVDPEEAAHLGEDHWEESISGLAKTKTIRELSGVLLDHPWDLINQNGKQLEADFANIACGGQALAKLDPRVAILGPAEHVFIHGSAAIDPFVVIDARHGPVSIDAGAAIQAFTRLEGPCHVGQESQLFRANVREGTTIGPVCRVGGEIEESILHGYVNKYHDGFLGHSYVCPWANLGAMTTNSDLKNDYSDVKVPLGGCIVDTGQRKVGCYIGDHSKTALGSLFNTGSSIGVMCMVLPGGELLPKHIPSFARIWHGQLDNGLDLQAALETADIAMGRRQKSLTDAQRRLLARLYDETAAERSQAMERARGRQGQQPSVDLRIGS